MNVTKIGLLIEQCLDILEVQELTDELNELQNKVYDCLPGLIRSMNQLYADTAREVKEISAERDSSEDRCKIAEENIVRLGEQLRRLRETDNTQGVFTKIVPEVPEGTEGTSATIFTGTKLQ